MVPRATKINPSMLRWARERAGYTVDDIAQRRGVSAHQVLDWEHGNRFPTWRQLEILAWHDYHRSTTFFFLDNPPDEKDVGQEFDRLPTAKLVELHPDTLLAVRQGQERQDHLSQLFSEEENRAPTDLTGLTGDVTPIEDSMAVAAAVRHRLNLGRQDHIPQIWNYRRQVLAPYRVLVEEMGAWVFKRSFKQKDITGFCMSHDRFPVIFLNCAESQDRQIFTLFNQLAHLTFKFNHLERQDDRYYLPDLVGTDRTIEMGCNEYARTFDWQVGAGGVAVQDVHPFSDLPDHVISIDFTPSVTFSRLGSATGVSPKQARRSEPDFRRVTNIREPDSRQGRGGYYAIKQSHLGERYIDAVFQAFNDERIAEHQLSEFLGVKGLHVERLAHYVQG